MYQQKLNRRLVLITLAVIGLTLAARGTFAQTSKTNGRIAFDAADSSGGSNIWTMKPDGSDQQQLTTIMGGEQARFPSWSADGTQIAFLKWTNEGGQEIWLMNSDGGNQRRLDALADPGWSRPSWSPDGSRIAFTTSHGLWVVNVDGSNKHYLGAFFDASWSPDGSHLVVSDWISLYVIQSDGGGRSLLWSDHNQFDDDFAPAWSPDGTMIAFTHGEDCDDILTCFSNTLWTVNPDGTEPRKISDVEEYGYSWSPDGKKFVFVESEDLYIMNADGSGLNDITKSAGQQERNPSWQPVPLPLVNNPIDDTQFFVHQQYADFLNREPDADGQIFWTNQIMACSGDPQCVEVHRINDSAAFYLSIEFQQTGYLVYRMYKAAYGNLPNAPVPVKFSDFLADSRQIGQNVVVLHAGWENVLENNKQAFAADFVQRQRFNSVFPDSISPDQFVDSLNHNAGDPLSQTERDQLESDLTSGAKSRAAVLRAVAENQTLAAAESDRAFVLMQYFGYLRRDPNSGPDTDFSGYNFWLNKLDSFHGDFTQAEMVKAFIESDEYRARFAAAHQQRAYMEPFWDRPYPSRPIERGQTRNPQREFCAITISLPFSSI